VTKYVINKANCRVIVTAPAATDEHAASPETLAGATR
jgi:hypothetical protein